MELSQVKTYKDLLEFIASDLAHESQTAIMKRLGINRGTYYKLMKGIMPGDRVRRKLNHFTEQTYGVSVAEQGQHIQVIKKQSLTVQGNFYGVQGASENFTQKDSQQLSFLLQKLMETETELRQCKLELEACKRKK